MRNAQGARAIHGQDDRVGAPGAFDRQHAMGDGGGEHPPWL